jgi:hypothetical protein
VSFFCGFCVNLVKKVGFFKNLGEKVEFFEGKIMILTDFY